MTSPPFRLILCTLFGFFLLSACFSRQDPSPPQQNSEGRPTWIDKVPEQHYLGQSSYALRTVKQAREQAIQGAIALMVAAKAGSTADVIGDVQNSMTSILSGNQEQIRSASTINTTVSIQGQEIPVQFRVVEFWQDRSGGYIYVLLEDLAA